MFRPYILFSIYYSCIFLYLFLYLFLYAAGALRLRCRCVALLLQLCCIGVALQHFLPCSALTRPLGRSGFASRVCYRIREKEVNIVGSFCETAMQEIGEGDLDVFRRFVKVKCKLLGKVIFQACPGESAVRLHRKQLHLEIDEYIRDKRFESLMSVKLCELTNDKIDRAFEQELAKPSRKGGTLSHKTVNDALNLVKSVLREYYKDLDVTVKSAEVQQSFRFLLPVEEVVEAVVGTDIELPAMLAMWLSLSASEIRGLTKSKSIRDGKLYIVETVVDVKGKAVRKAGGKEELRPRVFNIPPYIQSLIDRVDGDIIETRSAHAINQRFQKVLEQHGKQKMRFHDLRHLNASLMADKNIPTVVAQQRGGWKTDATMKKVYTHAFDQSRREADAIIDGVFEGIIGKITHENTHAEK